MARKKAENAIILNSWEECDEALRTIGMNNRDVAAIESVANEKIDAIKKDMVDRCMGMKAENEALAKALELFATLHKADFGKKQSKELNFGTIRFMNTTSISLPTKEKLKLVFARLRAKGLEECIREHEPTVNKEALGKYSAEKIMEVGATIVYKDNFRFELNETRLAE